MRGGVHGCLTYAPTPLAMEVMEIVRGYFTSALEIVAAQPKWRGRMTKRNVTYAVQRCRRKGNRERHEYKLYLGAAPLVDRNACARERSGAVMRQDVDASNAAVLCHAVAHRASAIARRCHCSANSSWTSAISAALGARSVMVALAARLTT